MIPAHVLQMLTSYDPSKPPANRDITTINIFDTIEFEEGSFLEERTLFRNRNAPKTLQNFELPAKGGRLIVLTHAKVIHNLRFEAADAVTSKYLQHLFETHSNLLVEVEDKKAASVIPLTNLIPWQSVIEGDTIRVEDKVGGWVALEDEIIVPPVGTFDVTFQPASTTLQLKGADVGIIIPSLPGLGLPDDLGWSIKVLFKGYVNRKVG